MYPFPSLFVSPQLLSLCNAAVVDKQESGPQRRAAEYVANVDVEKVRRCIIFNGLAAVWCLSAFSF